MFSHNSWVRLVVEDFLELNVLEIIIVARCKET